MSRLERRGIEPGAVQIIGLTVDTIETPQPGSIPPFTPPSRAYSRVSTGLYAITLLDVPHAENTGKEMKRLLAHQMAARNGSVST